MSAPANISEFGSRRPFDVHRIREDFPVLDQKVHGKPLVFLDSAASAQKPNAVIDEIARFYREDYANIHRGVYELSERATQAYEAARDKIASFINAPASRQVVFTSGTTAAVNLVAATHGRAAVGPQDEVLVTHMEHHSNIVPWQMLCQQTGARLRVAPIDDSGALLLDELRSLVGPRTKIVAVTHQSNALGTVNPVREIADIAHAHGAVVVVDGAQFVPHHAVDVQELDCDFYAFSGHKMYGPSGIGVLYAKAALLEDMPPWQGGGEMIRSVSFEETTYSPIPGKFEAGTPNIAGAVGLGAAVDYLTSLDMTAVTAHERTILAYASDALNGVPGLRQVGTAADKSAVLSFVLDGAHPHDIGTILDREGIAIRAGHHCAQPVMERFGLAATVRASLGVYTSREDIDALVRGLGVVKELFG